MTILERNEMFREFFENECLGTMTAKGSDYADDDDANENFKEAAEAFGITKYQAWGVYDYKHTKAIYNAIKRNPEHPERLGEKLKESIKDRINYPGILLSMLKEDEKDAGGLGLGAGKNEESLPTTSPKVHDTGKQPHPRPLPKGEGSKARDSSLYREEI